jgi:hypothetical protein
MINLDNAVLIGPGSEWFWTAISGLVLAFTLVALYRQLRLQRGAEAVEQASRFSREFFGEHLARHQLAVLSALQAGTDPTEIPGGSATELMNYWEEIGYLSRGGHLDVKLLWELFGEQAMLWWIYLRPSVEHMRAEHRVADIGEHFEWLAARIRELQDAKAGDSPSDELARQLIPRQVKRLRERIAVFEQERSAPAR